MEANEEALGKFVEIMNKDMTPQERAQALIDLQGDVARQVAERSNEVWNETQTKWQEEVRQEFGDKLDPTLGAISKMLDEFGTPELRDVFAVTGAGNNVHMVKFLGKVAEAMAEGKPLMGAPGGEKASLAERMYPSMKGE